MNTTFPPPAVPSVSPEYLAEVRRLASGPPRRVMHLAARFEPGTVKLHAATARTGMKITLVSTHPIPISRDTAQVPDALSRLIVADLGHLPDRLGAFDAVVVADQIEVPATLPVAWLRALADRGHLLVPLRGLGLLSATTPAGAGRAVGRISYYPGQGVTVLPDDIEPDALARLRPRTGTPVPAERAPHAVLLDRALPWLKLSFPGLRHHRDQHPDGSITWHVLATDTGSGAWARAHITASGTQAPTVTQADGSDLWDTLASSLRQWGWGMGPGHQPQAMVEIASDGTLAIAPVG